VGGVHIANEMAQENSRQRLYQEKWVGLVCRGEVRLFEVARRCVYRADFNFNNELLEKG